MNEHAAENVAPCHMGLPHDPHPWDTEDRDRLRYSCPGVTSPGADQ